MDNIRESNKYSIRGSQSETPIYKVVRYEIPISQKYEKDFFINLSPKEKQKK